MSVEGPRSLGTVIYIRETRQGKHAGLSLQRKSMFTYLPPGMLGKFVVYNLVIFWPHQNPPDLCLPQTPPAVLIDLESIASQAILMEDAICALQKPRWRPCYHRATPIGTCLPQEFSPDSSRAAVSDLTEPIFWKSSCGLCKELVSKHDLSFVVHTGELIVIRKHFSKIMLFLNISKISHLTADSRSGTSLAHYFWLNWIYFLPHVDLYSQHDFKYAAGTQPL